MTTPIVLLVLLMVPYAEARLLSAVKTREYDLRSTAAIGLGIPYTFTGRGYFSRTDLMAQLLPPWVPARVPLMYATGVLEFAFTAGFLARKFRRLTGWTAAAFLVAAFPANIYAAMNQVPWVVI